MIEERIGVQPRSGSRAPRTIATIPMAATVRTVARFIKKGVKG